MSNTCFICSSTTNDSHFGSNEIVCRACAAFFRRYVLSPKRLIRCKKNKNCVIHHTDPKCCRYCRMRKCVSAGMRESAVQAPREKYSKYQEPAEYLNYSVIPHLYRVQCCSTEMPNLMRISEKFKDLEISRRACFQNQEPPKSRNMGEIVQIFVMDSRIITKFCNDAFPELDHVPKLERKLMFLNLFVRYMLLEPPFLGFLAGTQEIILPNGDYYDRDVGRCYTGHLKKDDAMSEQTAHRIFSPYFDEYKRTIIDEIWLLKPDVFEFLTLTTFLLWDTGLDGLENSTILKCEKMREIFVKEIIFYYKNVKNLNDPCLRLAQTMMILSAIQRSFTKYQEELELCGFYKILEEMDGEAYKIINDSLQL